MAQLPADRTKLAIAQANQTPGLVASATANSNAMTEAYDTIDLLLQYVNQVLQGIYDSGKFTRLSIVNPKDPPFNAKGDGVTDDTAAIFAARDATPEGGILFFPQGTYLISQRLIITKSIHILGAHAEEDPAKSSTIKKTSNDVAIDIRKRGIRISNLVVTSSKKGLGDVSAGIVVGTDTIQCQNVTLDNVYVVGVGGDGILHQNGNNCRYHISVINNGGKGLNVTPAGVANNGSGNIFEVINAFGNGSDGVYAYNVEGNQYFITSQSNGGYGFNGVSINGSVVHGYTEFNAAGAVGLSSNSSANLIWGRWRNGGITITGANRGEDPATTNFFMEEIELAPFQARFVLPRILMLPQYQVPKFPEDGELSYNSTTTYSGERTLRMFDMKSWKALATRDYVDLQGMRTGTTAARPTEVRAGRSTYFDTTLGKPIWCKTAAPTWVQFSVTGAATASGNITLTIDGTVVTVPVVAGDTAAAIAKKIRQFGPSGWYANISGTTIVQFESVAVGDRTGANSFSGGTTGVTATVSKIITGAAAVWVDATGATV